MAAFFLRRVLESHVDEWTALGWQEVARENIPSLRDAVVLVEWPHDSEPPCPVGEGDHHVTAGRKDDAGKPMFSQLPPGTLLDVVTVLTDGAHRYGGDNWKRVENAHTRYFDAALRHLLAWWEGESIDPSSGRPHLAHAAANLLFLRWFERNTSKEQ